MAIIKKEQLKHSIKAILVGADLTQLSSKKVRKQLEEEYGQELFEQKETIDNILMSMLNQAESGDDQSGKANGNTESDSDSDIDEPEDLNVKRKGKKSPAVKKTSDADLARELQHQENAGSGRRTRHGAKPPPAKKAKKDPSDKPKKKTGYMKPCQLSPLLADIMGTEKLARSDVVKNMWALVKERGLLDPKNKQFMICDDQLITVFKKKRVRMFGMMKVLKDHIYSDAEYEEIQKSSKKSKAVEPESSEEEDSGGDSGGDSAGESGSDLSEDECEPSGIPGLLKGTWGQLLDIPGPKENFSFQNFI